MWLGSSICLYSHHFSDLCAFVAPTILNIFNTKQNCTTYCLPASSRVFVPTYDAN